MFEHIQRLRFYLYVTLVALPPALGCLWVLLARFGLVPPLPGPLWWGANAVAPWWLLGAAVLVLAGAGWRYVLHRQNPQTRRAEQATGRGYARKALLSSFIGIFPANDPKYAVLVIIDEPKGTKETSGFATGGWTAAPATSRIVARIAPMLGVEPVRAPEDEAVALAQGESKSDAVLLAQDH